MLNTAAEPAVCASIEGGGKYPAGSRAKTRYYDLADNCRWTGQVKIRPIGKNLADQPGCGKGRSECYWTMNANLWVIYEFEVKKKILPPTPAPKDKYLKPLPTKRHKPLAKPTLRPDLTDTPRPLPTKVLKPSTSPTLTPATNPVTTARSSDLTVRIDTGLKLQPIKLLCSGMSETSGQDTMQCQAQNKSSRGPVVSPNQWPIIVGNKGDVTVNDYIVDIVLSSDLRAPVKYAPPLGPNITEDVLIGPGRMDVGPPLGANSSAVIQVGIGPLPSGIKRGSYGLCAVVDPGNLVKEADETNNVFCVPVNISEFSKYEAGFSGTVYVDDVKMTNDATIYSLIDGDKTGETELSDGSFSLLISQPLDKNFEGLPIEFRLSVVDRAEGGAVDLTLDQTSHWSAGNISEMDFHLKKKRGFLVNPPFGEFGERLSWNNIDANILSIVGILLTLITAGISLFKSD